MKKVTVTVCILASAAAMIFSGCQKENGGSGKSGSDTEASADADKNFENGEARKIRSLRRIRRQRMIRV